MKAVGSALCPLVQSTNAHQVSAVHRSRSTPASGPVAGQAENWSRPPLAGDFNWFLTHCISHRSPEKQTYCVCVCVAGDPGKN